MNSAEEPLRKILADIPQKFSARIVLTLGGQCENMHQIGPFFERAQSAYIEDEKYRLSERLIIHPGDLYDQEQGLNLKMLQEMYQFMMAGDENNAIAAMKRFYECPADALLINLKERYYVLRTHIMMAAREIMPDHPCPEIRMIRCGNTLEEQTYSLIEGIRQVCGYVLQRKTSVQEDQCAIYTDYLKEHFSDPELCASSLANEFKVSEKYLFGLFKKRPVILRPASCITSEWRKPSAF